MVCVTAIINKLSYKNERTIVICNQSNEVIELADWLKKSSIFHYKCTDESESADIGNEREFKFLIFFFKFGFFFSIFRL